MSDIKMPEESLLQYFDELLHEMPFAASASEVYGQAKPRLVSVRPTPEPLEASAEQKQRLEKLLLSAPAQLLAKAPPRAPASEPELPAPALPVPTLPMPALPRQEAAELMPEAASLAPQPAAPEPAAVLSPSLDERAGWLANGRPEWAQSRFEVLLFGVSGLTLAVPLIALGQIQPLTDELTPLFGQADWFMGLQPTAQGKMRIVNTAKFVMPERYDERFLTTAKYWVSINGVSWGLAVDSVNQPISLAPEDVKWRSERSKRPWLAGTIKEHMCALLDIPSMGKLLLAADKNHTQQSGMGL